MAISNVPSVIVETSAAAEVDSEPVSALVVVSSLSPQPIPTAAVRASINAAINRDRRDLIWSDFLSVFDGSMRSIVRNDTRAPASPSSSSSSSTARSRSSVLESQRVQSPSTSEISRSAARPGSTSRRTEPSSIPASSPAATASRQLAQASTSPSRTAGSKTAVALISPQTTALSRTSALASSSASSAARTTSRPGAAAVGLGDPRRRRPRRRPLERRRDQAGAALEVVVEEAGGDPGLARRPPRPGGRGRRCARSPTSPRRGSRRGCSGRPRRRSAAGVAHGILAAARRGATRSRSSPCSRSQARIARASPGRSASSSITRHPGESLSASRLSAGSRAAAPQSPGGPSTSSRSAPAASRSTPACAYQRSPPRARRRAAQDHLGDLRSRPSAASPARVRSANRARCSSAWTRPSAAQRLRDRDRARSAAAFDHPRAPGGDRRQYGAESGVVERPRIGELARMPPSRLNLSMVISPRPWASPASPSSRARSIRSTRPASATTSRSPPRRSPPRPR